VPPPTKNSFWWDDVPLKTNQIAARTKFVSYFVSEIQVGRLKWDLMYILCVCVCVCVWVWACILIWVAAIAYENQNLIQRSTGKILFQLVIIIENFFLRETKIW